MWARDSLRNALIARLVTAFALIGLVAGSVVYKFGERYANLAYDRSLSDDVVTLTSQIELRNGQVQVNLPPAARMTMQIDSVVVAKFDVRSFDLGVTQAFPPTSSGAEISIIKQAGPFTAELLRLSASGNHVASAMIEVLDSLGVAAVTIRLTDVAVASDHVRLSGARTALEPERIAQQDQARGDQGAERGDDEGEPGDLVSLAEADRLAAEQLGADDGRAGAWR